VKHLDYIANPSIQIKNKEILAFYTEYYLPIIREDEELFKRIKNKIELLLKDCYEVTQTSNASLYDSEWNQIKAQIQN